MDYDQTLQIDGIDYGIVRGNGKFVFIKPGLGGNHFGCDNRYLKMAYQLSDKYGCSVIVASNPHDGRSHVDTDKKTIEKYISDSNIQLPELLFFGHSNGGVKGLELTNSGVFFKRMLMVNMPLMINLHKTKRYIAAIPGTDITLVYGENDPSFSYFPFIDGKYVNLRSLTVPGADHNFKGLLNEFIRLGDILMQN